MILLDILDNLAKSENTCSELQLHWRDIQQTCLYLQSGNSRVSQSVHGQESSRRVEEAQIATA